MITNILLGLIILNYLYKNLKTPTPVYTPITPWDAVEADLRKVFQDICERLPKDYKGSAFPVKLDIGTEPSWTDKRTLMQIIPAWLEHKGWVVTRDETCGPREIILDLPRKHFS